MDNAIDDDDDDETVDSPPRIILQTAIAWVATRDQSLTLSLQEWELEKIEELIERAGLCAEYSVHESWIRLRAAIVGGKVTWWGLKFVLPIGFEMGDVWPRGSQADPN
jgi:hypothetical protein